MSIRGEQGSVGFVGSALKTTNSYDSSRPAYGLQGLCDFRDQLTDFCAGRAGGHLAPVDASKVGFGGRAPGDGFPVKLTGSQCSMRKGSVLMRLAMASRSLSHHSDHAAAASGGEAVR